MQRVSENGLAAGDEALSVLASEAMDPRPGLLSRRGLLIPALLAIPMLRASRTLAREQHAPIRQLVKATVKSPQVWKPECMVGDVLIGQFTLTNPDQASPQDGVVRITLYDAGNKVESSTTTSVFVPAKGTLNTVFAAGPRPKAVGAKTLEFRSALNSVKISITAQAAIKSAPTKADMQSDAPKDDHCGSFAAALGMCR